MRLFIDGQELVGDVIFGTMPSSTPSDLDGAPFTLSSPLLPWRGAIDDVFVYDRPLSPAEIGMLFARGDPPAIEPPKDATLGYHFDGNWLPFEGTDVPAMPNGQAVFGPGVSNQGVTFVDEGGESSSLRCPAFRRGPTSRSPCGSADGRAARPPTSSGSPSPATGRS